MAKAGHKVAVLTEFPNYPSGIVPSRYRFKFFEKEIYHGLEVIRVYVKSSPKKNFINRMLFYLSFLLFSIVGAMKLKDRYDLVYATSPPLFVGLSGYVISRLKKAKFVFEVRDLWPESAVAIGALKNKTAIKLSHQLADLCYKRADKVVAVTRGIHNYLKKRKLGVGKLCIVPNGINLQMFNHSQNNASHKKESGYHKKFIVLYAGLLGLAQGIETLVEAAKLLRRKEEVLFLFVGNGPLREKLIRLQKSNRLENLLIIDDMPRKEVIKYITLADCCLVPLKKAEIFKTALPSKMFDAWACRKPIILSVDGEAREHLEKAKAGIYVEPEDSQGIANAIKYLFDNPQLCKEYGNNGRNYVKKHFSRKVQAERLEKILLEVLCHP
ncbi:MAG: glycosyltransferase family 4 protein [Candidatus Zixiibacteriota bacterium]